ncbi:hypothetical protein EV126DRAFT_429174 [Verticillium dahliae]|nr:hypothetical protein EV126DRAFT_429174 [Verticillium dahliae]
MTNLNFTLFFSFFALLLLLLQMVLANEDRGWGTCFCWHALCLLVQRGGKEWRSGFGRRWRACEGRGKESVGEHAGAGGACCGEARNRDTWLAARNRPAIVAGRDAPQGEPTAASRVCAHQMERTQRTSKSRKAP